MKGERNGGLTVSLVKHWSDRICVVYRDAPPLLGTPLHANTTFGSAVGGGPWQRTGREDQKQIRPAPDIAKLLATSALKPRISLACARVSSVWQELQENRIYIKTKDPPSVVGFAGKYGAWLGLARLRFGYRMNVLMKQCFCSVGLPLSLSLSRIHTTPFHRARRRSHYISSFD